jgi:hypothetical protein
MLQPVCVSPPTPIAQYQMISIIHRWRRKPSAPPEAPILTYPQRIAELTGQLLPNDTYVGSIAPLFDALGISHVSRTDTDFPVWSRHAPTQPDASFEPLVQATLLKALRSIAPGDFSEATSFGDCIAVLGGLVSGDRWRACLASIEDTHQFAALLIRCSDSRREIGTYAHSSSKRSGLYWPYTKLLREVSWNAGAALTQWLNPETPFDRIPSAEVLARELFGATWCALALDPAKLDNNVYITSMAMSSRPSFLPGLLSDAYDKSTFSASDLPDLSA